MNRLEKIINEVLLEKKLCKKGEAYRQRRMKPKSKGGGGEKHSAYLSARSSKLCEEQIDESKQVGIIYHYTTFNSGLKILQSNQLKSFDAADSTNAKPVFAISFTRDKRFHDNHVVGFEESSIGNKPQLRFTIDGNNLSNKFKVQPYSQGGAFSKDKKGFEAEERVISDKPFTIPLSDYLISVDVLLEYKKPNKNSDWMDEINYEMYSPVRAKVVKFSQDKNLPINLIVNKNGNPWPDKIKPKLINKILNWFSIKETDNPQSGFVKVKEQLRKKIQENLRNWFKEKWVRINTQGDISGECGTMKKGKATTRCLPQAKAQSLSQSERKSTVAKKIAGGKKGKQFVKNTKKAKYQK